MKRAMKLLAFGLLAVLLAACGGQKTRIATIGTGSVTGVYYPAGGAIGRLVNAKFEEYKLKVTVESTVGSIHNINALLRGDLDLAVAQSDTQFKAVRGQVEWEREGPRKDLRSVFSLHPESVTLVASDGSGIVSIEDLAGKRVNLGSEGTGQLQNVRDLLSAAGLDENEIGALYLKPAEAPRLLQTGEIDALFFTAGHPNTNIKEATSGSVAVRLIPIFGTYVEALLGTYPYYGSAIIPYKLYPKSLNQADVQSFGVKATLVASRKTPEHIVYAVTREVFENLDELKSLHPAFQVLSKENMMEGLSAPIHRGALKYYREKNMLALIKPELIPD